MRTLEIHIQELRFLPVFPECLLPYVNLLAGSFLLSIPPSFWRLCPLLWKIPCYLVPEAPILLPRLFSFPPTNHLQKHTKQANLQPPFYAKIQREPSKTALQHQPTKTRPAINTQNLPIIPTTGTQTQAPNTFINNEGSMPPPEPSNPSLLHQILRNSIQLTYKTRTSEQKL